MTIEFSQSEKYTNWYTWSCNPPMSFLMAKKAVKDFLSDFESVEYMDRDFFYFKFKNKSDESYFLLKSSSGIKL